MQLRRDPNFSDRLTAEALAGFLRAYSDAWRVRRIDRFVPIDFHLVDHQATLQGVITRTLIERFRDLNQDQYTELKRWRVRSGMRIPVLVPAFSEPKTLLHEFSIRDGDSATLAMLTRSETAVVSAAYLLTALVTSAAGQARLTAREAGAVVLLLTTLGYINPRGTAERFDAWVVSQHGAHATRLRARREAPLLDDVLCSWIEEEGDAIHPGIGAELRSRLNSCDIRTPLAIEAATTSSVAAFSTVELLLLYGIRDLLKVILNRTPHWDGGPNDSNLRESLASDPERLARRAVTALTLGMPALSRLVGAASETARAEFMSFLSRYTVYVLLDVELGKPFIVKLERTLPVGRTFLGWRELRAATGQTRIRVPLALKDANAVHVCVSLPDPEVRFGLDRFELNLRKPRWVRVFHYEYRFERGEGPRVRRRVEESCCASTEHKIGLRIAAPRWLRIGDTVYARHAGDGDRWHRQPANCPNLDLNAADVEIGYERPRWVRIGKWVYRPELRGAVNWRRKVDDWSLYYRTPDGTRKEVPVSQYFGITSEASEQLIQFYSGRGRYEGRQFDRPLGSMSLAIPIKLTLTIFFAYLFTALFFGLASVYVGAMWGIGIAHQLKARHEELPAHFDAVVAINALAVTLGLWLTAIQHRRPLVHKKLLLARYAFFGSMAVLFFAPISYGLYEVQRALA